jgi:hypothetical protein
MLSDRETSNTGEPGVATYIPQILNAVIEMMGPISQYPFNQLDTNDPKRLQESINNPDPRYLPYWYSWVIELFVRSIRPLLTLTDTYENVNGALVLKKNMWMRDPWYGIVNYALVGGPVTLFGIRLQIDTGINIALNDYPRRAVLYLGWGKCIFLI